MSIIIMMITTNHTDNNSNNSNMNTSTNTNNNSNGIRRHQTCYLRKRATSAAAELRGETHNVSRNRARTQVLPQKPKNYLGASATN